METTIVKTGGRLIALTLSFALILGSVAAPSMAAEPDWDLRWRDPDPAYSEMGWPRKIVSNLRVGIVEFVDSLGQGLFSLFRIGSKLAVGKVSTFVGDIVALIDHNFATQYVFQGVISRHLLRFGTRAKGLEKAIAVIHDTDYDPLGLELKDYIGHEYFHTDVWLSPSILVTAVAVVVADGIIRPLGRIITIFQFRGTGDSMNEYGKELIGRSVKVRFL